MSVRRIAWVSPSLARGYYLQPLFARLAETYDFAGCTGLWSGYVSPFEDTFRMDVLGKTRLLGLPGNRKGYPRSVTLPPRGLSSWLESRNPNVVFVTGFSAWTREVMRWTKRHSAQTIIVYSGSSAAVDDDRSGVRQRWRRGLVTRASGFLTNSHDGARYLESLGACPDRILASPYQPPSPLALCSGRELDEWLPGTARRLLYVGRLTEAKGLLALMDSLARTQAKGVCSWQLLLAGSGPLEGPLERRIADLDLGARVRPVGEVDYGSLGSLYAAADVFVFPTFSDVWGMAPFEAMAFGTPVACSSWAGLSEMIETGVNGWVFDSRDPGSMDAVIDRVCAGSYPSADMRAQVHATMETHSVDRSAQTIMEFATRLDTSGSDRG